MRPIRRALGPALLSMSLASCFADTMEPTTGPSATEDGPAPTEDGSGACVPGHLQPCVCPEGAGNQECNEDGTAYGPCLCVGGSGDSGTTGPVADSGTTGPTADSGTTGSGSGSDTTMGVGEGTSTGPGEGSTDDSGGNPCPPPDGSAIDQDCRGGAACPECYTCQPFVGFVLQETCQILCDPMMAGADCPPTHPNCVPIVDKVAMWYQCSS